MKLSRDHIVWILILVALWLMFMRPKKEGFHICFGGCTGWRYVNDAYNYSCPSSKPHRKVSRDGTQVNCCKCG